MGWRADIAMRRRWGQIQATQRRRLVVSVANVGPVLTLLPLIVVIAGGFITLFTFPVPY
jgi:hypothetical protein